MGYRSEVIFAVSPQASHAFMALLAKHPEVQEMCSDADVYKSGYEEAGDWVVYFSSIKWYDSYPEINALQEFIMALASNDLSDYGCPDPPDGDQNDWRDHFKFMRVGEDYEDVEHEGWGFNDIMLHRSISF